MWPFTKKKYIPEVGKVYQWKDLSPFKDKEIWQVSVLEVRDGWVLYQWRRGSKSSMKIDTFNHCFILISIDTVS